MLFNRHVAKVDATISGFCATGASVAAIALNIVILAKANDATTFASSLLMAIGVLISGLFIAIGWLKDDKKLSFIAAFISLPFYASGALFQNVDQLKNISDMFDASFPYAIGLIWYILIAVGLLEAFIHLVITVVSNKDNSAFNVSSNIEANSYLMVGVMICFAIAIGSHYNNLEYWEFMISCLSECALIEAMASTIHLYLTPEDIKVVSNNQ